MLAGNGQRERSVKPSAQPTQVRTLHLPPPAKMARELAFPGYAGRFPCPVVCHLAALRTGVLRGPRTYSGRESRPGSGVCSRLLARIFPQFARWGACSGLNVHRRAWLRPRTASSMSASLPDGVNDMPVSFTTRRRSARKARRPEVAARQPAERANAAIARRGRPCALSDGARPRRSPVDLWDVPGSDLRWTCCAANKWSANHCAKT